MALVEVGSLVSSWTYNWLNYYVTHSYSLGVISVIRHWLELDVILVVILVTTYLLNVGLLVSVSVDCSGSFVSP